MEASEWEVLMTCRTEESAGNGRIRRRMAKRRKNWFARYWVNVFLLLVCVLNPREKTKGKKNLALFVAPSLFSFKSHMKKSTNRIHRKTCQPTIVKNITGNNLFLI